MPLSRRPEPPLDLAALELADEISLIVAWREAGHLASGEIRVADDVAAHLREACAMTLERLQGAELVPYTPETVLEAEQALYVRDEALIGESPLTPVLLPQSPPRSSTPARFPQGRSSSTRRRWRPTRARSPSSARRTRARSRAPAASTPFLATRSRASTGRCSHSILSSTWS